MYKVNTNVCHDIPTDSFIVLWFTISITPLFSCCIEFDMCFNCESEACFISSDNSFRMVNNALWKA